MNAATLDKLAGLIAGAEAARPPSEVRLHPDDFAELRKTVPAGDAMPSGFTGLRVISDPDAPRLPRRHG